MRTNDKHDSSACRKGVCIECLREQRTPIIEACQKIKVSIKKGTELITEIVDKQCERIDGNLCGACTFPDKKWKLGLCNLATHLVEDTKKGAVPTIVTPLTMEVQDYQKEKMLNPLKGSKRGQR